MFVNSNKSSLSSSTRKTKFLVRRNSAKKSFEKKGQKKNKEQPENAANKQPYLVILVILSLLFIHEPITLRLILL